MQIRKFENDSIGCNNKGRDVTAFGDWRNACFYYLNFEMRPASMQAFVDVSFIMKIKGRSSLNSGRMIPDEV